MILLQVISIYGKALHSGCIDDCYYCCTALHDTGPHCWAVMMQSHEQLLLELVVELEDELQLGGIRSHQRNIQRLLVFHREQCKNNVPVQPSRSQRKIVFIN